MQLINQVRAWYYIGLGKVYIIYAFIEIPFVHKIGMSEFPPPRALIHV